MHDHKKSDQLPLTAAEREQRDAAEAHRGRLYASQRAGYARHEYTRARLEESTLLLAAVPEAYSAYNYRREILIALWASDDDKSTSNNDGDEVADANRKSDGNKGSAATAVADLVAELKLNTAIIEKDFKIYAAFVHRHWVYEEVARRAAAGLAALSAVGVGTESDTTNNSSPAAVESAVRTVKTLVGALTKERDQCERLLRLDARNFHAWNHRRWSLEKLLEAQRLMLQTLRAASGGGAGGEAATGTAADASTTDAPLPSSSSSSHASPYACLFAGNGSGLAEMEYTTAKIRGNFSNYSAWHQRALTIRTALLVRRRTTTTTTKHNNDSSNGNTTMGTRVVRGHHHSYQLRAPSSSSGEGPSEAEMCAALMALLSEDAHFLTHAVYCDPNDQSAWLYAPFFLSTLAACQEAFPHFFLCGGGGGEEPAADAATGALANNHDDDTTGSASSSITAVRMEFDFMATVLDLICEQQRLGSADCFLPHYFVFTRLANSVTATSSSSSPSIVDAYVKLAKRHGLLESLTPSETDTAAIAHSDLWRLSHGLYSHLITADPQRRGLYEDVWKVLSQH